VKAFLERSDHINTANERKKIFLLPPLLDAEPTEPAEQESKRNFKFPF